MWHNLLGSLAAQLLMLLVTYLNNVLLHHNMHADVSKLLRVTFSGARHLQVSLGMRCDCGVDV
jgi:hypothetical protein